jgi:hypothetical protein
MLRGRKGVVCLIDLEYRLLLKVKIERKLLVLSLINKEKIEVKLKFLRKPFESANVSLVYDPTF